MNTPCPCFCCGKQISYCGKTLTNVDFAVEVLVEGSYGSIFDLTQMVIWICDNCIEERMEERVFMINEDVTEDYSLEEENE